MSDELDGLDNKQLGELLLAENLKGMLRRIRSGDATAADHNVARQSCKDLGIQMIPLPGNPAGQLGRAITDGLPFAGDDAGAPTYQ